MIQLCPLCSHSGIPFYQKKQLHYFLCHNCAGIFMDHESKPDADAEIERYKEHQNDVENPGYQAFVSPITNAIIRDFTPKHFGLDFGAGTGPVISKVLLDAGYQIKQYDPYFFPFPDVLKLQYDFIACCEVIEHFYYPKKEFLLLKQLLKNGGKLYCMTDMYHPEIDFEKWYYKNDPTHVFLYQKETMHYIKEMFGFSSVEIEGRLITFSA